MSNSKGKSNKKLVRMVLCAIFIAFIIVMTVVPNFGYISTGIVEITTLHIIVILGACILGPAYGALLGTVWGLSCLVRAFTNPLWILFTNPLISVVPRMLVGLISGFIFKGLRKTKLNETVSLVITAVCGTLVNTLLVLTSMSLFGTMVDFYMDAYALIKTILSTLISINCPIEIAAAAVIVPAVFKASEREMYKYDIISKREIAKSNES